MSETMLAPRVEIKGFLETSFLDWPGEVASVLFLAGCNFRCPFCHNHGLVLNPREYESLEWADVRDRLSGMAGWVDGVVISGGEPTLSPGLGDLIVEIKKLGLKVKLDTNGSRPNVLAGLLADGRLDHVAMDVKSELEEDAYARCAGRSGFLEPVKTSLDILNSADIPYTLRTTVVPGLHDEESIMRLAGQLRFAPVWNLQKFSPENTLDCSYRSLVQWDGEFFDDLTDRALLRHKAAA